MESFISWFQKQNSQVQVATIAAIISLVVAIISGCFQLTAATISRPKTIVITAQPNNNVILPTVLPPGVTPNSAPTETAIPASPTHVSIASPTPVYQLLDGDKLLQPYSGIYTTNDGYFIFSALIALLVLFFAFFLTYSFAYSMFGGILHVMIVVLYGWIILKGPYSFGVMGQTSIAILIGWGILLGMNVRQILSYKGVGNAWDLLWAVLYAVPVGFSVVVAGWNSLPLLTYVPNTIVYSSPIVLLVYIVIYI